MTFQLGHATYAGGMIDHDLMDDGPGAHPQVNMSRGWLFVTCLRLSCPTAQNTSSALQPVPPGAV